MIRGNEETSNGFFLEHERERYKISWSASQELKVQTGNISSSWSFVENGIPDILNSYPVCRLVPSWQTLLTSYGHCFLDLYFCQVFY